ncbi:Uncharacterised protein [Porphyromonas cangingivalis]|nr:Uncharacterised protein [Porphyromonas cangingivalis]
MTKVNDIRNPNKKANHKAFVWFAFLFGTRFAVLQAYLIGSISIQ